MKILKALILSLVASGLLTATNTNTFAPFVYKGSVCFSPDEASELLDAVQLRPLYEQKIITLSNKISLLEKNNLALDNSQKSWIASSKKKNVRLFFMGASVGSGSTIAVLLVIIIKNAFF